MPLNRSNVSHPMVTVLRAVSPRVCIAMPDGLEAGEGVRKDPHPFVCGELV